MISIKNGLLSINIKNNVWPSLPRHCSEERSRREIDIGENIDDIWSHGNV